jgi:hypothetical protein
MFVGMSHHPAALFATMIGGLTAVFMSLFAAYHARKKPGA